MAESVDDESTPSIAGRPGAQLPRGTPVGRYVALDVLGEGGMGVVYRAWDPTLSRAIALKLVDAPGSSDRPVRERLLREAQALAQLSHANVVAIHDVGATDTGVFIAMELVEGSTLTGWLGARRRSEREILGALVQAGEGLLAAHRKGIIHRDFKPTNVMMGSDGRARVLDFGLARAVETANEPTESAAIPIEAEPSRALTERTVRLDTMLTQAGTIMGTPRYMSPEQRAGETASEASDQFSFCVAAWEALFGVLPFSGRSLDELERQQRAGELVRPPGARVSPHVERALRRGMAADPHRRHPSLAELLDQMRHDPVRRRRVILGVTGAVLAATLLGAGWLRGGRAPVCAVDRSALAGVWDAARRAGLEKAFTASGAPGATDVFASVAVAVDHYADAWIAMRRDACLATRVRGDQSEHLMDLRMQCLDRRRDGLRAQIDVLSAADRAVVSRAAEAARALAPLEECADAALLETAVATPADPEVRQRAAAATRALGRVQAELAAGLYDDAAKAVAPIEHEARELEVRPLLADIELTHGRLLDRRGDYDGAEREYWSAVADGDAGRADLVRAEALTQLVWMIGERNGHYAEARQLATVARGAIDRLDRPDRVLARYYRSLGVLDYREGKYRQALEASQHAAELARRAAGANDDPYVASCVMDVGLAHYYLGDYAQAKLDVEQALAIWRKAFGPNHGDVAAALDNLGEIEHAMNHLPQAIDDYRAAAAIWERLGSFDRADALVNIGEIERSEGHLGAAEADLRQAVAVLQQRFGKEHRRLAAPLVGLGRVLVDEGKAAEALPLVERGLRLEDAEPGDPVERADGWLTMARALGALGRQSERAHKLASSALGLYRGAGARGSRGAAEAQQWLARAQR